MSGTINKVFVDSSAIIETYKGNPKSFDAQFFSNPLHEFYVNEIVLSEVLYFFVGSLKGISPLTMKKNNQIGFAVERYNENPFVSSFSFLHSDSRILNEVPYLMGKYNLLPNDAINIGTCILNNIYSIATLDPDFKAPCEAEGILILNPGNI